MNTKNNEDSNNLQEIKIQTDLDFDEDSYDIMSSLSQQVNEQLDGTNANEWDENGDPYYDTDDTFEEEGVKKKKHLGLKIFGGFFSFLILFTYFLVFTKPGNHLVTKILANYISDSVQKASAPAVTTKAATTDNTETEEFEEDRNYAWNTGDPVGRQEDYVTNVLLFGIEEIGNARNTDTMMIASINTKTRSIHLTSLMRDSYVMVPGWKETKLNAAYAHGDIELLRDTIEENYKIHLDGYASVNFESFEELVDILGGVEIQLGEKEANYLNTTNYISNKAYRNVKVGMNTLNGNQALGYCRVRKVPTYDGVNNDFGRTLRQRRVLNAIFQEYKDQNIIKLFQTTNTCLSYITTNLTTAQIETLLNAIVDYRISEIDMKSLPIDGAYESPKVYNGTTWPIVLDWDSNILDLYQTIYGDTEEEAQVNLSTIHTSIRY